MAWVKRLAEEAKRDSSVADIAEVIKSSSFMIPLKGTLYDAQSAAQRSMVS